MNAIVRRTSFSDLNSIIMPISEVYNMDCMEYMKDIPNAFYDLAIIDPPYWIGEDGLKNHSRGNRAKAK